MPRITVNFSFLCAKGIGDQISKTAHAVQEFPFSGAFIISNRRLHQMSGCIKLVAFTQVAPPSVWFLDRKIRVDVTILTLSLRNQVNDLIRCLLKRLVRITCKRKSDCLQPFCHVSILKYRAVEFARASACRNTEVLQAVARLRIRNPVIHCLPLIRNDRISYQVHVFRPERIADLDGF